MTPEQLEAHRVRFEQQFYAVYGFEPCRSGPAYGEGAACDAWQLYQRVLTDADRAQRAAPGVQGGEVRFGGRCEKHLSPKPCAACAQPPQQSAQPSMQDALAAGDGTLHGAIDYWQAKCKELEAKLAQSAQPLAWMHETPGRVDVIHDEVKKLLSAAATDYLHRPIDKSEKYTIPLYAAAQPVEATVSLGPPGSADRYFFEKGYEKGKRDAQPVEVQRVLLTDEFLRANGVMVHGDGNVFFTNVQQLNRVLGIKPTSSEGGA